MQPIQSSKSAWPQDPQSRNYQHNNQEFHLNQQRHRLPMPGGLSHHGPSRRPPTPDGQLYRPRPPPVRLPPPGVPPPGVPAPPLAPSMALPLPDFSRPPPNISVPPPTTNQPFGGAFMRGPPPAINRPSHDITHPPPAINHPPHAINRPPHAINHPPPAINRPPSAITRPPSVHYGSSPFDNTRTDVRARKPFPLQNQIMSQSMAFQNRPSLGPRRPPPPPCSMARPPFQLNTERPMGSHGPPTRGPGFPHRGGLRPPFSQRLPFSGNQNKKRPAQQNDKSNPKKAKVDNSAELNFYCEICDREYRLEKTYKEHLSTHVKCGFEGCSYVAAKRLVDQHIQQQHRTGFAKKIWQLQSPKDIEAWRADRKKNYPTTETIARKKAAQEEKMKRGEVLDTKQFGKLRKRGPAGSKDTQEDLDAVEMSTSGEQDNKSEDLLSDVLKKELSDDIIDGESCTTSANATVSTETAGATSSAEASADATSPAEALAGVTSSGEAPADATSSGEASAHATSSAEAATDATSSTEGTSKSSFTKTKEPGVPSGYGYNLPRRPQPKKPKNFNKKKHMLNPWMTEGLLNLINKKNEMYRDWRSTVDEEEFQEKKLKYTAFNNIVRQNISAAKSRHDELQEFVN